MKPFHTIAIPHEDILEGRLTMDVFAADLWDVYQNRGPDEYRDSDLFFRKTFLTKGLTHLFSVIEKRIKGKGGDGVIQLQTPFGGGKTHSLIALYHKTHGWKAKRIVIVGTSLNPKKDTLWGLIEKQLTGKVMEFEGNVSPGKGELRELLEKNQPMLVLMDEVLEYVTKASGIKVGDTTLAAQTIAFLQEITEVVSALEKTCLIITLPSSIIEHYDENAENLFQKLQKVTGRVEKIYTPVDDDEITSVVRKRLFSEIDGNDSKDAVSEIMDYFKKENLLPVGIESSDYRNRFMMSYPFLPDVVECLYHRWGSFPTFQRTRGVLRLLSLVIYSLRSKNINYVSLADIDLNNQELRRELLKHIGNEFDSVIAADITDINAGSKYTDKSLGESYKGLQLGTRSSTTIFLNSFSGGPEKGTTINEIKRSASVVSIPSSVVSEAVDLLKERLFYIQQQASKIYFTNKPNLNRILLNKIENIADKEVMDVEKEYLIASTREGKFKTYIWPTQSNDILDNPELKLIILREKNDQLMKAVIETKGDSPRVYRNTLFFLTSIEEKKNDVALSIKRKLSFEHIEEDPSLELSDEQKKGVKKSISKEEENIKSKIREAYRVLYIPSKETIEETDLGIPTYGYADNLSGEAFDKLKSEGIVIEGMVPIVLKEKYLKGKAHVFTKQIYENSLKTLGERRILGKSILENCITDGVKQGIFGLGELKDEKEIPLYWKNESSVGFSENEILIDESICSKELMKKEEKTEVEKDMTAETSFEPETREEIISRLELPMMEIPKGKVSQILGLLNYVQTKFDKLQIKITASEGLIKKEEYENKIKEALRQMGIGLD